MKRLFSRCLLLALGLSVALAATSSSAMPPATTFATGLCDAVSGEPPIGPPEPEIAGTITDAGTSQPIAGATVELYRCDGTTPVYLGNDTTNNAGGYAFADLASPEWYVVQALLTGPLAGMTAAGGTVNPTSPIGLGESAMDVDLAFD